jgi:hypothetical protein
VPGLWVVGGVGWVVVVVVVGAVAMAGARMVHE